MPVADAAVALVEKRVGGDVVFLDVGLDFLEGPVGERVDLDETLVVDFDDVNVAALAALGTTTAGEDSLDVKFAVCTRCRLDLGHCVVKLIVGFPETFAVLRFEVGGGLAARRLVDVHLQFRVVLSYAVDKLVGLVEVVEGVEEDQIDLGLCAKVEPGNHVHDSKASKTEGRSLVKAREGHHAPFEDFNGFELAELLVDVLEMRPCEVDIGQAGGGRATGISRFGITLRGDGALTVGHCCEGGVRTESGVAG